MLLRFCRLCLTTGVKAGRIGAEKQACYKMNNTLPYYPRSIVGTIKKLSAFFPCVLITGARQVGKSTLLKDILPEGMRYVTLDNVELADEAQRHPLDFLDRMGCPLCIDEIQYAPALFRAIKQRVDENRRPGMYWLTGSQRFRLMKGVTESLAGRLGIVELFSLSQWELAGQGVPAPVFNPAAPQTEGAPLCNRAALTARIFRGSYPELAQHPDLDTALFFQSYVQSYVERDVQDLSQVGNKSAFIKLMRSAAARSGQQPVYSDLARDADVSPKTAKAWVSILEASGLVTLLEPYYVNTTKRLVKAPKIYFMDTGLCCWLLHIRSAAELENSPFLGALTETWAFGQLMRNFHNRGEIPNLSYYRDANGAEVDFLLESGNVLFPIEVKAAETAHAEDLRHVKAIPLGRNTLAAGTVLCAGETMQDLGFGHRSFPISAV